MLFLCVQNVHASKYDINKGKYKSGGADLVNCPASCKGKYIECLSEVCSQAENYSVCKGFMYSQFMSVEGTCLQNCEINPFYQPNSCVIEPLRETDLGGGIEIPDLGGGGVLVPNDPPYVGFNPDQSEFEDAVTDNDGNLYIVGKTYIETIDERFGPDTDVFAMTIWKLRPNGTLDVNFGDNGRIIDPYLRAHPDFKISEGVRIRIDNEGSIYALGRLVWRDLFRIVDEEFDGPNGNVITGDMSVGIIWKISQNGVFDNFFGDNAFQQLGIKIIDDPERRYGYFPKDMEFNTLNNTLYILIAGFDKVFDYDTDGRPETELWDTRVFRISNLSGIFDRGFSGDGMLRDFSFIRRENLNAAATTNIPANLSVDDNGKVFVSGHYSIGLYIDFPQIGDTFIRTYDPMGFVVDSVLEIELKHILDHVWDSRSGTTKLLVQNYSRDISNIYTIEDLTVESYNNDIELIDSKVVSDNLNSFGGKNRLLVSNDRLLVSTQSRNTFSLFKDNGNNGFDLIQTEDDLDLQNSVSMTMDSNFNIWFVGSLRAGPRDFGEARWANMSAAAWKTNFNGPRDVLFDFQFEDIELKFMDRDLINFLPEEN